MPGLCNLSVLKFIYFYFLSLFLTDMCKTQTSKTFRFAEDVALRYSFPDRCCGCGVNTTMQSQHCAKLSFANFTSFVVQNIT